MAPASENKYRLNCKYLMNWKLQYECKIREYDNGLINVFLFSISIELTKFDAVAVLAG